MSSTTRAVLPAVTLLAILGCAPAPTTHTFTDADRTANLALTQAFHDRTMAKDWEGVGKLYAADAVMLPPNTPALHGPAAIKGFMAAFPPITAFTLVDDTIVGTGDRAYAIGHYHLTLGLKGAPQDSGKFLDVRERQADGSWLYVADMFSSDIPAAAP